MTRHLAFPALAFALLAFTSAARAADCVAPRDAKVAVEVEEAPIVRDQSFSYKELSKRSAGLGLGKDGATFGATEAQHATELAYALRVAPSGSQVCVTTDRLTVTLKLSITVHLASELKPGSCLYKAVADHEQRHVDLEHKLLPTAQLRIQAALASLGRDGVTGKTSRDAAKAVQDRAWDLVDRALDGFVAERDRKQAAYDTPEEYAKLSRRCSKAELRKVLGR